MSKPTREQVINKLWAYSELEYHCDGKFIESKESALRSELGDDFDEAYSEVYIELMDGES